MLVIYVNSPSMPSGLETRHVTPQTAMHNFVEMPGMPYSEADENVKARLAVAPSPMDIGPAADEDTQAPIIEYQSNLSP